MVGYDDMTLLKVYGILLLLNTIPSFATTEQIVDSDDGYTHTPGTCLLQVQIVFKSSTILITSWHFDL